MKIAQVQVDAAYWQFNQNPPGRSRVANTAWVDLPFPGFSAKHTG